MEAIKIDDAIRKKLREAFPSEAISQHPTKTFLSTIKAIYIVERLNDIFGIGGWTIEHEIISDASDYVTVKGRLIIFEPYNITTPYQYGGHKKTGTNTEPADGYKSAVTDCQSKCASYLEIGIDVFKGLVKSGGQRGIQGKKEGDEKTGKELSKSQWKYIKDTGAKKDLTEIEVTELVKWVAEQNSISPRHWKISTLLLPIKNFEEQLDKYLEAKSGQPPTTDEPPGFDDVPY